MEPVTDDHPCGQDLVVGNEVLVAQDRFQYNSMSNVAGAVLSLTSSPLTGTLSALAPSLQVSP